MNLLRFFRHWFTRRRAGRELMQGIERVMTAADQAAHAAWRRTA